MDKKFLKYYKNYSILTITSKSMYINNFNNSRYLGKFKIPILNKNMLEVLISIILLT